jgi:hypothetical protein
MTTLRYATYAVLAFAVLVNIVGLALMLTARKRHGCEPCVQCSKMTSLYFQGKPVCIDCDRKREGEDKSVPIRKPPQAETANQNEHRKALGA